MESKQHATKQTDESTNKDYSKKYLEMNENENTTFQNPWDEAKAIPGGKLPVVLHLRLRWQWFYLYLKR